MKCLPLILLVVACLAASGCISTYRAQLANKIPRVDADKIKVTGQTIYGVSGELTETDVKWVGDTKTIGSSTSRVTSPLGGFTVEIEKGKLRK